MNEMPSEYLPLDVLIHNAFHKIAEKYNLDVDLVSEIIVEYDKIVGSQLNGSVVLVGLN